MLQNSPPKNIRPLHIITVKTGLGPFPADTPCKLNVFRHDSHPLRMYGAEISIFKQTDEISLRSLLKCQNSMTLKSQIRLEVLGNFSHKPLKWQLSN